MQVLHSLSGWLWGVQQEQEEAPILQQNRNTLMEIARIETNRYNLDAAIATAQSFGSLEGLETAEEGGRNVVVKIVPRKTDPRLKQIAKIEASVFLLESVYHNLDTTKVVATLIDDVEYNANQEIKN